MVWPTLGSRTAKEQNVDAARQVEAVRSSVIVVCVCVCVCVCLRSAGCHQLFVPRHRRSMFGRRAFTVAGPAACNSSYGEIRHVPLTAFAGKTYWRNNVHGVANRRIEDG